MFLALVLFVWVVPASGMLLAPAPIQEEALSANGRFGVCHLNSAEVWASHSSSRIEERYQRAQAAGVAWTRWPMYWPSIEDSSGSFNYAAQDAVILADLAHGMEVNAILMNTPSWCTTASVEEQEVGEMPRIEKNLPISCYQPGGYCPSPKTVGISSSPVSPPQNLYQPVFTDGTDIPGPGKTINPNNYWARFISSTVSRYRPGSTWLASQGIASDKGVRYWEMWNEPDIAGWFWDGTVADYYRLLKVGYLAAKFADPGAVVLLGGLAHWHNPGWFPQLLDLMKNDTSPISGYWPYFDILPWHWYSTPYHLYEKTIWARSQLSSRGLPIRPIWVNETNVPAWNDYPGTGVEGTYQATTEEQAAFIVQAAAWGFAAGVERVFVHQLYDDCPAIPEAYGLVRNLPESPCYPRDGTVRPAYTAYQVASSYLAELTSAQRINHTTWEEIDFTNSFGQRVRVVWATVGQSLPITLSAYEASARLIGQDGNVSFIYPSDGHYSLTLPPATNDNNPGLPSGTYMIGGKPFILVEELDRVPPISRVEVLPQFSPTSFRVKWGGTDAGSGIASYNIWFSEGPPGDQNPRIAWITGTTATSAIFAGVPGQSYYYASRATDWAGNQEAFPTLPQASTTLTLAVAGGVYDSAGGAIAWARVTITDELGVARKTATLADGSFQFLPLPRATYQGQAWAKNFGLWPARRNIDLVGQNLARADFYLPPLNNLVRDGGFEGDLAANWMRSGSTPAVMTNASLSGRIAALLGTDLQCDTQCPGGNSTIHQTITIPQEMEHPILSFMYRLETQETAHNDGFEVIIIAGGQAYYLPNFLHYWQSTGGWQHVSHDLSAFRGQTVDLYFNLWQSSPDAPTLVWLDEVSVGTIPAYRYSFGFPLVRKNS